MIRHREQFAQASDRTSGNIVVFARDLFDFPLLYSHMRQAKLADRESQEFRAQPPWFNQGDRHVTDDGNHQSGKPRPRTNVAPTACATAQAVKLCPVKDMPLPQIWDGRRGDEILGSVRFDDQCRKELEFFECFT